MKEPTFGEQVFAAISPFLFSKHTASREELRKAVAPMIDREIDRLNAEIERLKQQIEDTACGWGIEDVLKQAGEDGYKLDENDAREVLHKLQLKGDVSIGVTWDTLSHFISEYCDENNIAQTDES